MAQMPETIAAQRNAGEQEDTKRKSSDYTEKSNIIKIVKAKAERKTYPN